MRGNPVRGYTDPWKVTLFYNCTSKYLTFPRMPRICPGIGPPVFFWGRGFEFFTGCQARIQSNTALPFGEELQEETVDLLRGLHLSPLSLPRPEEYSMLVPLSPADHFRAQGQRNSIRFRTVSEMSTFVTFVRRAQAPCTVSVLFHRAYASASTRINGGKHDLEYGQLDNIERGVKVDRDKGLSKAFAVECKDLGWIRDSGMFPRLNFRFQIGIFIWSVQEAPDDLLSCSRGWRTQFLVDRFLVDLVRNELLV